MAPISLIKPVPGVAGKRWREPVQQTKEMTVKLQEKMENQNDIGGEFFN